MLSSVPSFNLLDHLSSLTVAIDLSLTFTAGTAS